MIRASSRLLPLAAALAALACGPRARSPAAPAPTDGPVVLGTFTAEVDPAAGTFRFLSDPPPAAAPTGGRPPARVVVPEGLGTLTVANTGATVGQDVWNGAVSPTAACGGALVTGARVALTADPFATSYYAGVYAEITGASATGVAACNADPAPVGLSTLRGTWAYGEVGPYLPWTTTVVREWNFLTASAARFTFTGRIVGAAVNDTAPGGAVTAIAAYGALGLAYAVDALVGTTPENRVGVLDPTGIDLLAPVTIPRTVPGAASISAVASDGGATPVVWYARASADGTGSVGLVRGDGSRGPDRVLSVEIAAADVLHLAAVPGSAPLQAVLASGLARHLVLLTDGGASIAATSRPLAYAPAGLVVHPNGSAYVADPAAGLIHVVGLPTLTETATVDAAAAGCPEPGSLAVGPGSVVWIGTPTALCAVDVGAAPPVVTVLAAGIAGGGADVVAQVCAGADGAPWLVHAGGPAPIRRFAATADPLRTPLWDLTLGGDPIAWCAGAAGSTWAAGSSASGLIHRIGAPAP